jgi:hypothetical protein
VTHIFWFQSLIVGEFQRSTLHLSFPEEYTVRHFERSACESA